MGYGWWATAVRCIAIVWTLFEWYVGLSRHKNVVPSLTALFLKCRALNASNSAL